MRASPGIEVAGYHLKSDAQDAWSSCWRDYRQNRTGDKALSSQVCIRVINNSRSTHATGDLWQCDQPASSIMKVNAGSGRDITFCRKAQVSHKQSMVGPKFDEASTAVTSTPWDKHGSQMCRSLDVNWPSWAPNSPATTINYISKWR